MFLIFCMKLKIIKVYKLTPNPFFLKKIPVLLILATLFLLPCFYSLKAKYKMVIYFNKPGVQSVFVLFLEPVCLCVWLYACFCEAYIDA